MTITAPVNPELADTPCSVAECLKTAHTMGSATVLVDHDVGAPPDFRTVTFGLPLCADHAQLLRLGCTLNRFHSGL